MRKEEIVTYFHVLSRNLPGFERGAFRKGVTRVNDVPARSMMK
jgi:hypothetical protein